MANSGKDINFGADLLPEETGVYNLGGLDSDEALKKWNNIYGNNIYGNLQGTASGLYYATTAGGTSTYTATVDGITEYYTGLMIVIKFNSTPASGATLNINSLGAKTLKYSAQKSGSYFTSDANYLFVYDGTYFTAIHSYNSNSNTVPSAYCDTSSAKKVASLTNYTATANSYTHIVMRYDNSSATALTLNINSQGAKPIYINGEASSTTNYTLPAGTYIIYYDGTNYYFRTDGILTGTTTGNLTSSSTLNAAKLSGNIPDNCQVHYINSPNYIFNLSNQSYDDITLIETIDTDTLNNNIIYLDVTIPDDYDTDTYYDFLYIGDAYTDASSIYHNCMILNYKDGEISSYYTEQDGRVYQFSKAINIGTHFTVKIDPSIALNSDTSAKTWMWINDTAMTIGDTRFYWMIWDYGVGNWQIALYSGKTYNSVYMADVELKNTYSDLISKDEVDDLLETKQDKLVLGNNLWFSDGALYSNNTWRGIQDNLTSTSTTDSLSANQGKVLKDLIDNLPDPMIFKGSLGTNGTITSLPSAAADNIGYTYKVITAGTYASQAADVGDTFISDGSKWNLIPSGNEPSGTVTSVATDGTALLVGSSGSGPITTSGTISHSTASGYKHIPSGGSSGQFLKWSADGTATWAADNNTNYYHTTGSWSGLTYTATANGGAGALALTIPTGTTSTTVAVGNHTHSYAGSSSAGGAATSVAYSEGTADVARNVWFSDSSSIGKLVYDNDFKYNPSTNVLTVGSITGNAATATSATSATKATQDSDGNTINSTYLKLSGGTLSGDLNFSTNASLHWNSNAYRQRITVTDDSTTDTAVFTFQQSSDTGSTYTDLMTIKDNGKVVATTFVGNLTGTASGNLTSSSTLDATKLSGTIPSSCYTNTDTKVTNTLGTTTKYYLTGTTSASTNTGTQTFDTGIYATTTAGQLNATTYKVNEAITLQYDSTNACLNFVFA